MSNTMTLTWINPQHDEWAQSYSRNNKRAGQKHLRCFPTHGSVLQRKHNENGFCGQGVVVCVNHPDHLVINYKYFDRAAFVVLFYYLNKHNIHHHVYNLVS